jgi:hypothetical protein
LKSPPKYKQVSSGTTDLLYHEIEMRKGISQYSPSLSELNNMGNFVISTEYVKGNDQNVKKDYVQSLNIVVKFTNGRFWV